MAVYNLQLLLKQIRQDAHEDMSSDTRLVPVVHGPHVEKVLNLPKLSLHVHQRLVGSHHFVGRQGCVCLHHELSVPQCLLGQDCFVLRVYNLHSIEAYIEVGLNAFLGKNLADLEHHRLATRLASTVRRFQSCPQVIQGLAGFLKSRHAEGFVRPGPTGIVAEDVTGALVLFAVVHLSRRNLQVAQVVLQYAVAGNVPVLRQQRVADDSPSNIHTRQLSSDAL